MKKLTLAAVLVFCFFLLVFVNPGTGFTEAAKPLSGSTGAPGEPTCAQSGCHVGNPVNVDAASLTFQSPLGADIQDGYIPDSFHHLSLTIQSITSTRFGFQMTALDQNNNKAGNFVRTETSFTELTTYGNRQYISHKNARTQAAFSFRWEAPQIDIGPVTFYFTACAADGDSTADGDLIYMGAATATTSGFTRLTVTGIQPINADEVQTFRFFPNPFNEKLNVEYYLHDANRVTIELFSLDGKLVKQLDTFTETPGFHRRNFSFDEKLTAGIYLLRFTEGEKVYFKKLIAE